MPGRFQNIFTKEDLKENGKFSVAKVRQSGLTSQLCYLTVITCVTLSRLCGLSEPPFLICKMEMATPTLESC